MGLVPVIGDGASLFFSVVAFAANPNWDNAVGIGGDLVGVLPGVPAFGTLHRLERLAETGRQAERLAEGVKNAEHFAQAAKGAGPGAQQTFEILDGVRRSKAAEMAGQTTVKAEVIGTGGQMIDVPLDALRSPKTVIDATTNSSLQRWMNTLKQTMSGSPAPPILVQPGTRGTPIPGVTVEY